MHTPTIQLLSLPGVHLVPAFLLLSRTVETPPHLILGL